MEQKFIPGVLEELENINYNRLRGQVDKNFFRGGVERLKVLQGPIVLSSGDTSGLLTWDVGNWDEKNWANLNTSDLSGVRIINHTNVFYEPYLTSDFVDSTASDVSPSGGTITLAIGEVVQSEVFALNNVTYTFARMSVVADDSTVLTLEISFDGGSNWETVTNGTLYNSILGTISGLKYRLTNTGASTSVLEGVEIVYG